MSTPAYSLVQARSAERNLSLAVKSIKNIEITSQAEEHRPGTEATKVVAKKTTRFGPERNPILWSCDREIAPSYYIP